jgi:AcrR family transcriptional regulator
MDTPDPQPREDAAGAGRRPGRRRSQVSREAILQAATDLLVEQGYAAASIEKIAQRAGVGKQTIYRWWPSKGDVLMEALARKADTFIPLPDEGSWAADLRGMLQASHELGNAPQIAELLRALMVEAQLDPVFGERGRAEVLQRRRAALTTLVERARERGDLPAGLTADFAAEVVFGVIWYRLLALPRPFDDALADHLVALLTNGSTDELTNGPAMDAAGSGGRRPAGQDLPGHACRATVGRHHRAGRRERKAKRYRRAPGASTDRRGQVERASGPVGRGHQAGLALIEVHRHGAEGVEHVVGVVGQREGVQGLARAGQEAGSPRGGTVAGRGFGLAGGGDHGTLVVDEDLERDHEIVPPSRWNQTSDVVAFCTPHT